MSGFGSAMDGCVGFWVGLATAARLHSTGCSICDMLQCDYVSHTHHGRISRRWKMQIDIEWRRKAILARPLDSRSLLTAQMVLGGGHGRSTSLWIPFP